MLHFLWPLIPYLSFHGQRQTSRAEHFFLCSPHCLKQRRRAFRNRHGYELAALGLLWPLYDDRRTVGCMQILVALHVRVQTVPFFLAMETQSNSYPYHVHCTMAIISFAQVRSQFPCNVFSSRRFPRCSDCRTRRTSRWWAEPSRNRFGPCH